MKSTHYIEIVFLNPNESLFFIHFLFFYFVIWWLLKCQMNQLEWCGCWNYISHRRFHLVCYTLCEYVYIHWTTTGLLISPLCTRTHTHTNAKKNELAMRNSPVQWIVSNVRTHEQWAHEHEFNQHIHSNNLKFKKQVFPRRQISVRLHRFCLNFCSFSFRLFRVGFNMPLI